MENLQERLEGMLSPQKIHFKSEGERRIAYFLDDNRIRYQYEPGVLVNTAYDKPRIWYPDFHLPEFASYRRAACVGRVGYQHKKLDGVVRCYYRVAT